MSIRITEFGTLENGQKADLITLTNRKGLRASFTNFGGSWVSMEVPDRQGKLADVVWGFSDISGYAGKHPHFGAIVGRVANRVDGGRFVLHGKTYQMAVNKGSVALHSGPDYWEKRFWAYSTFEDEHSDMVTFQLNSPHGDQGFPGEARVLVSYVLSDDNALTISYSFMSDQDTPVNLTHHAYFNLAGQDSRSILDQEVWIDADAFLPCDEKAIPTGEIRPVEGTPMDFRSFHAIGERIGEDYDALAQGKGYDHNYVLNHYTRQNRLAAKARDPKSGRVMEVYTDLPGMQLYTGNFLEGNSRGKGGNSYPCRSAFCFETQFFPNALNTPSFEQPVAKGLEEFLTETTYKFLTE